SNAIAWNEIFSLTSDSMPWLGNAIGTAGLSVGQHTLYIKEDYWQNMVGESDETNNVRSVTFNVTAPSRPDLVVDSINVAASVVQGANLGVYYVVRDLGSTAAGQHYVGIMVDQPPDDSHYLASNNVASLAGGGGSTLSNSISTAGLSGGQHTLYVK